MTSERMKELNREWFKTCLPIYLMAFSVVAIFIIIMTIVAIICAIATGELLI